MCGIIFTTKDINNIDLNFIIEYLKYRGPDLTNVKKINNYTFIHTLLSMTGPPTEQPFYNSDKSIVTIFNGEIYNFDYFGEFNSDGECIIPLYEKFGVNFIKELDGEFAIVLVDFNKNILLVTTDIFGTRPLWMGFDDTDFGISTYGSCLDRIGIKNYFQILANKTYIFDLETKKIIEEKQVHTFDLKQYKTNFDDWNKAFSNAIYKRVKHAKTGIFIGMSGGYDSGAIACELTKQNIDFTAYSIINVEDKEVMIKRKELVKNTKLIELSRDEFLNARSYLKTHAEEYNLNIDNGEKDKYNILIKEKNFNKEKAKTLIKLINFRKKEQILTDDNGAIGCSYICSLAIKNNQKIYLSGSGADEIFSDYGFNKHKYFDHSTIGGYFPEKLESVFPWKNFFGNTQRAYLMKEEYVAGSYGIEGRYPFLDKYVVQEFLWLHSELKNKNYKSPLYNYLNVNNFPFEINQKTGFGCGFTGPSADGIEFKTLTEKEKQDIKVRKVTDLIKSQYVDFDYLLTKKTKSYENYDILDKSKIEHIKGNCYKAKINLNYPGLKYINKSRYTLLENNNILKNPVTNHELIFNNGNGNYCFWTSNYLYFSTSDNSNPITNGREYSIIKLNTYLRNLEYENFNSFNGKKYYITILKKNCNFNSNDYFKIREIFNYFNYIPNILVCDNHEIFMDIPNIIFKKYEDNYDYTNISRIVIEDLENANIDYIRNYLFDIKKYDDNYKIIKGTQPKLTISILTIGNNQFQYALESALSQDIDLIINIIKNNEAVEANNKLINNSNTDYTIQMDEDMIFFSDDCAKKMLDKIISEKSNTWNYCYSLKDDNFGVTTDKQLLGIKIFNIKLMKEHKLYYSENNSFAIDREIQILAKEKNLISNYTYEQIGYHQKNFGNFDLFLRCSKIGFELFVKPLPNWGNYEYGIFLRYITKYNFEEFILTSSYIIYKLNKNPEVFFNKLKQLKEPKSFTDYMYSQHDYLYDDKSSILDDIKKDFLIPFVSQYNPNKDIKFYCLFGFIFPIYFNYNFDYRSYPYELFNIFI